MVVFAKIVKIKSPSKKSLQKLTYFLIFDVFYLDYIKIMLNFVSKK